MPIPVLNPGASPVNVQTTSFSIDALGRFICSTWEEATANGGPPFTAVIIGAGMYGSYLASRLFRHKPGARVLVLDAGRFLVSEHVQNLSNIGLNVPAPIAPALDPGVARELVWGMPWRGNVEFPGLAYCTGGKSIYWGGWCPRLTSGDLAGWPAATALYLQNHYIDLESETGVEPANDFMFDTLGTVLRNVCIAAAATTANIETTVGTQGVQTAPLAVQGSSPQSGLFSFDKFSSLPVLIEAIRDDVAASGVNDAARRLFLVPLAHAIKLHASAGTVHTVEVDVAGQRRFLPLGAGASVVLAASAIESTRLALFSFPTALMGRNLMAHVRSDFAVRVKRSALPPLPADVETAAFLVRGKAPSGRFHVQVTASTHSGGSDELLFRMIPDLELLQAMLANTDPNWISFTFRGIGEMAGDRASTVPNASGSWIDLSPFETDEFGVPRAFVQIKPAAGDLQTWNTMDQTMLQFAQTIAGAPGNIEYLYDGGWQTAPFPLSRPFPAWHNGLGTTYHEAGTLWMGAPGSSVTDSSGRFHHIANAYACDQSLFPTVGSVNPVLTGLTLARQLADQL
jgi:choline dehydrogenase-like flavoprotein